MLLDSFYSGNFRIALLKDPFNDALDGHLSAGAACAVALQAYFDDIVVCIFNKLNISSVSLQKRSDLIQCILNFLFHVHTPLFMYFSSHRRVASRTKRRGYWLLVSIV